MAASDIRAIETYETLAARAAHYGLIDLQARALLDLSYFISHTSAERCLEAAQRALRLSDGQAPPMRTRTRAACAFRRLSVNGWNAQDALELREGLAELCQRQDFAALDIDRLEDSHIRFLSGEYRAARRIALELRAEALEPGANPALKFAYDKAGDLASVYPIFLGEWGGALKELAAALAEAQKNADDQRMLWLRVHQAWLHLHALDFRSVLKICQLVLAPLQGPELRAAPPGRRALILSGCASGALGDYACALESFSVASSEMDHQTRFFDWYWRMPLAAGLTEL
jgi:hypothetical protein